jgi:hypothetical protein
MPGLIVRDSLVDEVAYLPVQAFLRAPAAANDYLLDTERLRLGPAEKG